MLYSIQTAATLAQTWVGFSNGSYENGSDWNSSVHPPPSLCFEIKQIQVKLFLPSAAKEKSGEYPCGCRHLGSRPAAGSIAGTAKRLFKDSDMRTIKCTTSNRCISIQRDRAISQASSQLAFTLVKWWFLDCSRLGIIWRQMDALKRCGGGWNGRAKKASLWRWHHLAEIHLPRFTFWWCLQGAEWCGKHQH